MRPIAEFPADRKGILEDCRTQGVRFLRLQFPDILGTDKNVESPRASSCDPYLAFAVIIAKLAAWPEYSATVHPWELDRYLAWF